MVRDSLVVVHLSSREYRAVYSVNTAPEVAVVKLWDRAQHQAALVINRDMTCKRCLTRYILSDLSPLPIKGSHCKTRCLCLNKRKKAK